MKRQRSRQSQSLREKPTTGTIAPLLYCFIMLVTVTMHGVAARFAHSSRSVGVGFIASQQLYRTASSNANTASITQQRRTIHSALPKHDLEEEAVRSGYSRPVVQWYPGHIAKAERQLKETFKAVDVVVEVRDARAAKATSHPMVGAWCAGRPRLVVLTHVDAIPSVSQTAWTKAFTAYGAEHPDQANVIDKQVQNQASQALRERLKYSPVAPSTATAAPKINSNVEHFFFVNAKDGAGIHALTRAIFRSGSHVQERRGRRGLKERPLRVGVIGYPNVGKSALINRLLGRKRAKTADRPGVTKSLQWIHVRTDDTKSKGKEFELLDSPGVIPAVLVDQSDATLLAACNCIGDAAYDNQAVAAYLCEWLLSLHRLGYGQVAAPDWRKKCKERYNFDPLDDKANAEGVPAPRTGEDMVFEVADSTCMGDPEDASRKILQDFRSGRMGQICLQVAPATKEDKGQTRIKLSTDTTDQREERLQERMRAQEARAQAALETAKERGLGLPPVLDPVEEGSVKSDQVGKGQFEGW